MPYQPDDDRFYQSLRDAAATQQKYTDRVAEDQAATTRQLGQMYGQAIAKAPDTVMSGMEWAQKRAAEEQKMQLAGQKEQRDSAEELRKAKKFAEDQTAYEENRAYDLAPATEEEAKGAGVSYTPDMTHQGLKRGAALNELGLKDRERLTREKDVAAQIAGRQETARIAADAKQTAADTLAEQRRQFNETRATAASEKADAKAKEKATADQGKAYTEMAAHMRGGRGASPDYKQALNDEYNISKGLHLMHGDLNKLTKQEAALIAGEMEKVATGSAGTEAGRQGLDPHTFNEEWSVFKNKFVGPNGEVEPANLGKFLERNKAYLEGVQHIAHEKVRKYRRGVFEDYAGSGRLSEEHQQLYRSQHPDEFPEDNGGIADVETGPAPVVRGGAAPVTTAPGTAQAAPAGPSLEDIDAELRRRGLTGD